MARFTFTNEFRKRFSEKLMDLGNLSAAALVFGQFASPKEFSISILIVGLFFTSICYIVSFVISS